MKIVIKNKDHDIEFEYDESKYKFEHFTTGETKEPKDVVVIRNKDTNEILHIFDGRISFVSQQYDKVHHRNSFIVGRIFGDFKDKMDHYIEYDNKLRKDKTFNLNLLSYFPEQVKINNSSYIYMDDKKFRIFNLDRSSDSFDHIYNPNWNSRVYKEDLVKTIGENTVIVEQTHKMGLYQDEITYGIDANTFEIKTPIWSKLQGKIIQLYDKEKAKEYIKKHQYMCTHIYGVSDISDDFAGQTTIIAEVIGYLDNLQCPSRIKDIDDVLYLINKDMSEGNTRKRDK